MSKGLWLKKVVGNEKCLPEEIVSAIGSWPDQVLLLN